MYTLQVLETCFGVVFLAGVSCLSGLFIVHADSLVARHGT